MVYIGYFESYKDGELIDDWKEWCEAESENEARNYFEEDCPIGCKIAYIRPGR